MTYERIFAIFSIAFGGWLALHCPRAALVELRSGVAKGRVNTFRRDREPLAFWLTIVATALAGVMGFFFFAYGIAMLGMGLGLIG